MAFSNLFTPSTVREYNVKTAISDPGSSSSPDPVSTSTLILGFRASKTKKYISVAHKAFHCVVLPQQPVWTATSSTQHFNIILGVHFHWFAQHRIFKNNSFRSPFFCIFWKFIFSLNMNGYDCFLRWMKSFLTKRCAEGRGDERSCVSTERKTQKWASSTV